MKQKYPPGPAAGFLGWRLIRQFGADPLAVFTQVAARQENISHVRMAWIHAYFVNHPDLIHDVLSLKLKSFRKHPVQTKSLARIQGNGLVSSHGDFWRRQRRLVQPALHASRFPNYIRVLIERTRKMLDEWQDGNTLDVEVAMTDLVIMIIGDVFLGVDIERDQAERFGEALDVLGEIVQSDFKLPFVVPDWVPRRNVGRRKRAAAVFDDFIRALIKERRANLVDRGDLLSMLMLAVDPENDRLVMTDEEVRAEALTLFNAAYDSTAAGLTWTLYCVAQHPDVEARLLAEIDDVLGTRLATYDDVPRLEYTNQVVKESLRLYPPVPLLFTRQAVEDVDLGGYTVPKGAYVFMAPWMTHRDSRFFPNAEKFDPDRFSKERAAQVSPWAYFPFSGGPHICVGSVFAQIEMTMIIAMVLQRFRMKLVNPAAPIELDLHVSVRPRGGMPMQCVSRRQTSTNGEAVSSQRLASGI